MAKFITLIVVAQISQLIYHIVLTYAEEGGVKGAAGNFGCFHLCLG